MGVAPPVRPRFHCWEGHKSSLDVYLNCAWRLLPVPTGMSVRLRYDGIEATEIESVARLLGVPKPERRTVFRNVRLMARAAAPVLNGEDKE